jgi:hypothetical protein
MVRKKKLETVEDILDRIMEDIDLIREKCVCNGEEDYFLKESDDVDSTDEDEDEDEDEDRVSDDDEDEDKS